MTWGLVAIAVAILAVAGNLGRIATALEGIQHQRAGELERRADDRRKGMH